MNHKLLSRDQFRNSVFERDNYTCVLCGAPGQDAHHIMERRLFSGGGYYVANGATVCGPCHIKCETTEVSCEEIREAAGISATILPEHLYTDNEYQYDKWGNIILANGTRLKGDLFFDESVQKIIAPYLHLFSKYIKYPRTYHVPWSQPGRKDDKYLSSMISFKQMKEVVITEKMDGENTSMYNDHIHARSINSGSHPTRNYVKGIWSQICWLIDEGWRVCGENLYAKHTVEYQDLESYFLIHSIWDEKNYCLSWEETKEYAKLFDLPTVKELYRGPYNEKLFKTFAPDGITSEGWVIRNADAFHYKDFRSNVAKYVGDSFILPHGHWRSKKIEINKLHD